MYRNTVRCTCITSGSYMCPEHGGTKNDLMEDGAGASPMVPVPSTPKKSRPGKLSARDRKLIDAAVAYADSTREDERRGRWREKVAKTAEGE